MTFSRSRLVDAKVSRWYHCIERCVRRAVLICEETAPGRKDWIENQLRELNEIFAISVGGFSLMDNHLHLLLRIDPEVASSWTDSDVVERWFKLFPPRGADRKPMKVSKEIVAARLANVAWVAETLWLVPIEDRREQRGMREGMRIGFSLAQYLMLVEYSGRILRDGKAAISSEVADIFARLGCTPKTW